MCSQVIHLGIQAFVCLALMHTLRPGIMEKAVFVWAMGYLCFGHIYRMYYDYGGYTLDITGSVELPHRRSLYDFSSEYSVNLRTR